jgi:NTP pyrophosphatase (non-canonical NTP hydrolase)
MENEDFEIIVNKHSLCKGDLLYNSNALAGEVGECANMVKKISMATIKPEWTKQGENRLQTPETFMPMLVDEIGDALFYLTRLSMDLGMTLSEIMELQTKKLINQSIKYKRDFLK